MGRGIPQRGAMVGRGLENSVKNTYYEAELGVGGF